MSEQQCERGIETTILKIKLNNGTQLYIISVYCSGSNRVATNDQFQNDWRKLFEKLELSSTNNYYIIAGDLNACHTSWGNVTNNTRGASLNRWIVDKEIEYRVKLYKPDAPTFIRSGNYLDLAITDNRLNIEKNYQGEIASHIYDGDHKAIELICRINGQYEVNTIEEPRQLYNFFNTDWTIWKNKLIKHYKRYLRVGERETIIPNDRNLTDAELDEYINNITDLITQNITANAPKIRRRNNMECYTNNRIESLYKHKSRLITYIKRYKRRGPNNMQQISTLKTEIKRTNELIIQNIKIETNKFWKHKLESIKPGPKMFANIKRVNQLKAENKVRRLDIEENEAVYMSSIGIDWSNIPKRDRIYISSNEQQNLNILGYHIEKHTVQNLALGKKDHELVVTQNIQPLKQQHIQNKANHVTKVEFSITNRANTPNYSADENYFVSVQHLTNILKCVNNKKSFGLDNIPSIILKHLPEQIIMELCTLFNNLLNNKSFPSRWKTAKIYPIKKKNKNPTNPENYRPISLLSNLGKIYEIIIYEKLQQHINNNNLIPDNQFGFRYGHSTIHAITKLTSDVCYKLNDNICTGAVMIDMKKAFESVWLDGLLFKMYKMKFHTDLLHLLYEMLYNRKFVVTNGSQISNQVFNLYNGLQQGSITAPILFNLYTADLISNMNLNSQHVHTIAYADDIVIYSANSKINTLQNNLQKAMNFISEFLHTWRIEINTTKCETILFRKAYQLATNDTKRNWKKFAITINNIPIEQKPMVKYLGINLDQLCYINEHINLQLVKARKAFISHKKIFYAKHINSNVKEICYKALIRPIITYGCQIWFNLCPSYMEKIRIFERKCIRHVRGIFRKAETGYQHYVSNQSHYNKFNAQRIDVHIINIIRNHILRTTCNPINSLLFGPFLTENHILRNSTSENNIPGPEAFVYLDKKGYIQDENDVPLIYHVNRRPNEKWFDPIKFGNASENIKYSTAKQRSVHDSDQKRKTKYWWLQ